MPKRKPRADGDDFPLKVAHQLSNDVGLLCSNPVCRRPTVGPHTKPEKNQNVGIGAHITASRPSGPRYDATLTSDQRRSAENGIWVCAICSRLVDGDASRFTVEELRGWKREAMEE